MLMTDAFAKKGEAFPQSAGTAAVFRPLEAFRGFDSSRQAVARMAADAFEFRAFLSEPPQMASGATGKAGYLRLAFEHDEERGRTVLSSLDRRVPLLAQKALYWEESQPGMACVIVIATTGCTVQGDRLALDVSAGPGSCALVTTQCASKVHSMEHNYAAQLQRFRLGEGSYLEYMPDALILHRSARYLQDTLVTLPASASFVYGEILMPGRRWHHEEELFGFDMYSAGLRVMRPGAEEEECGWDPDFGFGVEQEEGEVLFEERLVLEPDEMEFRNVAIMGGFEVLGSLYALVPERFVAPLKNAFPSDITDVLAWGVSILPRCVGVVLRVLGHDTESVRAKMREFHSLVRERMLGRPLPPGFLWR